MECCCAGPRGSGMGWQAGRGSRRSRGGQPAAEQRGNLDVRTSGDVLEAGWVLHRAGLPL